MKDMVAQLERLRKEAAECELIRDLATNSEKRDLFARLAEHLNLLALQVEMTIENSAGDTFLGRRTYEPFPEEHDL